MFQVLEIFKNVQKLIKKMQCFIFVGKCALMIIELKFLRKITYFRPIGLVLVYIFFIYSRFQLILNLAEITINRMIRANYILPSQ